MFGGDGGKRRWRGGGFVGHMAGMAQVLLGGGSRNFFCGADSSIDWRCGGGYNFPFYVYRPDKICLVFIFMLCGVFDVRQLAVAEIVA